MKRSTIATLGIHAVALAAAKDAGTPAPAAAPATAKPAEGTVTGIDSDIAIPERKRAGRGGGKSPYPFEGLEVGQSFGVVGKTKKNFNSIIYGANKRYSEVVKNPDGSPVMEQKKDRKSGNMIMVEKTRQTRLFEAFDVDPKTDPKGASVRIFRMPVIE